MQCSVQCAVPIVQRRVRRGTVVKKLGSREEWGSWDDWTTIRLVMGVKRSHFKVVQKNI